MYLTNENLMLVKKNESEFVSLKYPDLEGNLCQIDSMAKNILTDPNNHGFEINKNLCLLPLPAKGFNDPFRSLPTTSFLCVNIADQLNIRHNAFQLVNDLPANMVTEFEGEINFWLEESQTGPSFSTSGFDPYADLRSDILDAMEKIHIVTTIHHASLHSNECVIGFKGENMMDLADNFILAKFVINNIAANYRKKNILY